MQRWQWAAAAVMVLAIACGAATEGAPTADRVAATTPTSTTSAATSTTAPTATAPPPTGPPLRPDPTAVEVDTEHCPPEPPTDGPIRIGVNGGGFTINSHLDALQAEVDQANARGGIDDRPVELIRSIEEQSDSPLTEQHLGQLLDRGDLHAVVPWGGWPGPDAIAPRFGAACVPGLFWLLAEVPDDPWLVPGLADRRAEMTVIAEWIGRELTPRRVLVLGITVPSERSISSSLIQSLTALGIPTAEAASDPNGSGRFHSDFIEIDAVVITTPGAVCGRSLVSVRARYPDATVIVNRGCSPSDEGHVLFEGAIRPGWVLGDHEADDFGARRLEATARVTGQAVIESLEMAATMPGGVTRLNVLRAARSLSFVPSGAVDGIWVQTSWPDDEFGVESAAMFVYEADPPSPQAPGWHQLGPVIRANGSTPFSPIDRTRATTQSEHDESASQHCVGPGGGTAVIRTDHWFGEEGVLDPLADIVLVTSGLDLAAEDTAVLVAVDAEGTERRFVMDRGSAAAVCADEAFWDLRRADAAELSRLTSPIDVSFEIAGSRRIITEQVVWPQDFPQAPPFGPVDLEIAD